jgi:hypothetical protein
MPRSEYPHRTGGRTWYGEPKREQWQAVARRVLLEPPRPHPTGAAAALREIGARIVFDSGAANDQQHKAPG